MGERPLSAPTGCGSSIVKPEYSSTALVTQIRWGTVEGQCPGEAFLMRDGSESSQLLSFSPVHSLFEGITYFLCQWKSLLACPNSALEPDLSIWPWLTIRSASFKSWRKKFLAIPSLPLFAYKLIHQEDGVSSQLLRDSHHLCNSWRLESEFRCPNEFRSRAL